jgi:hypothetical protein
VNSSCGPVEDGLRALADLDATDWLNVDLPSYRSMPPRLFVCPACKRKRGVDINFGYPTPELVEQVERNEAVLGGCSLPLIGDPERQCLDCGHQWEIVRRPRAAQ